VTGFHTARLDVTATPDAVRTSGPALEALAGPNARFKLALALACACGFISLAYEIMWARLFSFASGSLAPGFAAMLGGYLFGLAAGSLISRRWQNGNATQSSSSWRVLSGWIVISNVVSFLVPPAASWLVLSASWVRFIPLVMLCSALMGIILPLLCHMVISADHRAGARMSYIYLANIIGAGGGSLVTGFLLTEWLRFWQIAAVLLSAGVVVGAGLLLFLRAARMADGLLWVGALGLACASPRLHDGLFERLQFKQDYKAGFRFERVIEGRHGIISVTATNLLVYGNGVYDGVIETGLTPGSSLIRPYFISALHPDPKQVLVIGMSAGAWTQILVNHPQVQKVTVVEIDRGYLKLIKEYPQVSSLLTNSRVQIHIDDGRRWLRRNPEQKFDAIVMNTSYHWREFASALLSKEFLETVRQHLQPDGLVMWNSTGSPRAIRTGLEVFPHVLLVGNNCVGSMSPLVPNGERWSTILKEYRIEGKPLFDLNTVEGRRDFQGVIGFIESGFGPSCRLVYRQELLEDCGSAPIITDDNLGDEYIPNLNGLLRALVSEPTPSG
jgi:spermidine synthase